MSRQAVSTPRTGAPLGSRELPPMNRLGANLRAARHRKGISQAELADLASIGSGWISLYESGQRVPTLKTIAKICLVLDLTIIEVLAGADLSEFL